MQNTTRGTSCAQRRTPMSAEEINELRGDAPDGKRVKIEREAK